MSLKDRLKLDKAQPRKAALYQRYGITANPFPASNQTSNNPRLSTDADQEAETRVVSFMGDGRSQVVVVEGTQGVGKTNFLNNFEAEIRDALEDEDGFYLVRYLADPEASFDGTIRKLLQELGVEHLGKLAESLRNNQNPLESARMPDMRAALHAILRVGDDATLQLFLDWLLGSRLLNAHRYNLRVQFRLDTVESRTSALRDIVVVSSEAGILRGIFLLLDELEKQDGVLGPTAVVRYLSAMRAIIDALPNHLFLMIAVTPDAMRRYSAALPAFRSRLQNQIILTSLTSKEAARGLAHFYLSEEKATARRINPTLAPGSETLISDADVDGQFANLLQLAERRGDVGVRQREFLHTLHKLAEDRIQQLGPN